MSAKLKILNVVVLLAILFGGFNSQAQAAPNDGGKKGFVEILDETVVCTGAIVVGDVGQSDDDPFYLTVSGGPNNEISLRQEVNGSFEIPITWEDPKMDVQIELSARLTEEEGQDIDFVDEDTFEGQLNCAPPPPPVPSSTLKANCDGGRAEIENVTNSLIGVAVGRGPIPVLTQFEQVKTAYQLVFIRPGPLVEWTWEAEGIVPEDWDWTVVAWYAHDLSGVPVWDYQVFELNCQPPPPTEEKPCPWSGYIVQTFATLDGKPLADLLVRLNLTSGYREGTTQRDGNNPDGTSRNGWTEPTEIDPEVKVESMDWEPAEWWSQVLTLTSVWTDDEDGVLPTSDSACGYRRIYLNFEVSEILEPQGGYGFQDVTYPGTEIGYIFMNGQVFTLYQGVDHDGDKTLDLPAAGAVIYNDHLRFHRIQSTSEWVSLKEGDLLTLVINEQITRWILRTAEKHSYDVMLSDANPEMDIGSCFSNDLGQWSGIVSYELEAIEPIVGRSIQ